MPEKSPSHTHPSITDTIIMVEPVHFGFNLQTAKTNPFQQSLEGSAESIQNRALAEFWAMVQTIKQHGITVLTLLSRKDEVTPDSVFPNNWFSHHQDGKLIFYPMLTPNRRAERQTAELQKLLRAAGVPITQVIDLSGDEGSNQILEGTGSLVLDRKNKLAFAMESPRTSPKEFEKWCELMEYKGVFFNAYDAKSFPIYHTNVMMNIGQHFAVVCLESIKNSAEQALVARTLELADKEILAITIDQMYHFCGNIIQVMSETGAPKIIMSQSAFEHFTPKQMDRLEAHGDVVPVAIPTIEQTGGGSARCMIAEVFGE